MPPDWGRRTSCRWADRPRVRACASASGPRSDGRRDGTARARRGTRAHRLEPVSRPSRVPGGRRRAEAGSVQAAVAGAEVVVLMLFGPESVRAVLPDVLVGAPAGVLIVDGTTIGPAAAREFGALCAVAGARYAEAPVAGSVGPATAGTLGVFVGASERRCSRRPARPPRGHTPARTTPLSSAISPTACSPSPERDRPRSPRRWCWSTRADPSGRGRAASGSRCRSPHRSRTPRHR